MKNFKDSSLLEITQWLESQLRKKEQLSFIVPNPDVSSKHFGYKAWVNLAELHFCKMLTPQLLTKEEIRLTFKKLIKTTLFMRTK